MSRAYYKPPHPGTNLNPDPILPLFSLPSSPHAGVFVVGIYSVLNISRICICKSLLMIFWRNLNDPLFDVYLNCDQWGTLLNRQGKVLQLREGRVVDSIGSHSISATAVAHSEAASSACTSAPVSASSSVSNPISTLLARTITKRARMGVLVLAVGLLINASWVWALQQITSTLAYVPDVQRVIYRT